MQFQNHLLAFVEQSIGNPQERKNIAASIFEAVHLRLDATLLQALANLLDHRDIGSDDKPQRQSAVGNCV